LFPTYVTNFLESSFFALGDCAAFLGEALTEAFFAAGFFSSYFFCSFLGAS
jgi:hypothetical protein